MMSSNNSFPSFSCNSVQASSTGESRQGKQFDVKNFPAAGDSLMNMTTAAAPSSSRAFDMQIFARSMLGSSFNPTFLASNGDHRQTTGDIAAQVLEEISEDIFDDDDITNAATTNMLIENPIAPSYSLAFEPIPLQQRRGVCQASSYRQPSQLNLSGTHQPQSQSRLGFLEDTLNRTLEILSEDDDFGMFDGDEEQPEIQGPMDTTTSFLLSKRERSLKMDDGAADFQQPSPLKKARTTQSESSQPSSDSPARRFRPYQAEQWSEKFQELLQFKAERGHVNVPHTFEENPTLARWVKRQRYQYKLKKEGKQSTMTDQRIIALEEHGFIWDSHAAVWQERCQELAKFKAEHGDCNVPSNFCGNPQLATWVKCQRRQFKLYWEGKNSNMNLDRIQALERIGFEWELRGGSLTKNVSAMMQLQRPTNNNNNNNNNFR